MVRRFSILFLFAFLICSSVVQATHIVGGELRYRCLDNNTYELSLIIYRDCFYGDPNAWFDDPASIGIFDGQTDTLVTSLGQDGQVLIPLMGNDTLDPNLNDPCLVVPPSVCVHTTTYRDTVNLPFREGGYTLAYQRCCRNQTLQNIVDPLASGATYLVRLTERALELGNSSPEFRDWPPIYICTDKPIDFDHSATDSDGDSLVYKLCTPLLGANQVIPRPQPPNNPPYDSVVWVDPPYNLNNLLGGEPLTIDSATGFMTGIPNNPGQYVVGVCVEEYRNGKLIGRLRRDFQYNVGICGRTTSAFTAPDTTCAGNKIQLVNESMAATHYTWIFGDLDDPDSTSQVIEPSVQYDEPGIYPVTLIAFNGTGCSDTTTAFITVQTFLVDAEIQWEAIACTDSFHFQLMLPYADTIPGDPVDHFEWIISSHQVQDTSNKRTPSFTVGMDVEYVTIRLHVMSSNGCSRQLIDSIPVDFLPDLSIPDTLFICPGTSVRLNPNATDDSLMYHWAPDDGSLDDPTSVNPQATPANSTLYTVDIVNNSGCQRTDSVFVGLYPELSPFVINASKILVEPGEVFTLSIPFHPEYANVSWSPQNAVLQDTGFSVEAAIDSTTLFVATVADSFACTRKDSITIEVIQCPSTDTIEAGFAKNTCLVGQGYNEQIMEVEGFIPVPPEYEACGLTFMDVQGGYFNLDDYHINPINGYIKFEGWFHVTDDDLLAENGNRILANVILCTPDGVECLIPITIRVFMGTAGMCQMDGFMCSAFLLNWEQPATQKHEGWMSNSFQLYLPFLTSYIPDTCQISEYEAEILIRYSDRPGTELYDTFRFHSLDHIIWEEDIHLCQPDYRNAESLIVRFWNNCGDSCTTSLGFRGAWRKHSTSEESAAEDMELLPNPADTEISFTWDADDSEISLQIYNREGKSVLSEMRNGSVYRHHVDIRSLRAGLYFLMVEDSDTVHIKKFIKQ